MIGSAESAHASGSLFDTIALSGNAAGGENVFVSFRSAVLNSNGDIAFRANVAGPQISVSNDEEIWHLSGGGLRRVVGEGDVAPSTEADTRFAAFSGPVLGDGGHIAFFAELEGPGVAGAANRSIWLADQHNLSKLARGGESASGVDVGVTYSSLALPVVNAAGEVAFFGIASGNQPAIWSGNASALSLIAIQGAIAPGTDTTFRQLGEPYITNDQILAFRGVLPSSGVTNFGIWSGAPENISLVARKGELAPDIDSSSEFYLVGSPRINANGDVVFAASLSGPDITPENLGGMWKSVNGELHLVARIGDIASGTESVFADLNTGPMNEFGDIAFVAQLTGPGVSDTNDWSVWVEIEGSLRMIAREGMRAPGTSDSVVFSGIGTPSINRNSSVVFTAGLSGENVDATNDFGIWGYFHNKLKPIVREGDLIDVEPNPIIDDLRTVSAIEVIMQSNGEDGSPSSFNCRNSLVFVLEFTDGTSGLFTITVPESSSISLLCFAVLLLNSGDRSGRKRLRVRVSYFM